MFMSSQREQNALVATLEKRDESVRCLCSREMNYKTALVNCTLLATLCPKVMNFSGQPH